MTGGHGRGVVWPPEGVEPAAPAPPRPGARLQPWRTPSGTPAQRVIHPPAASAGERLTVVLADVADSMVALGEAAKQAAAAMPQLPEGEPSADAASRRDRLAADVQLAADLGGAVVETPDYVLTVPSRKYLAPPVDTSPGWIGRLRRRLFGEPPQ